MEPRFPLGEVYASAGVAARLVEEDLHRILHRHHYGDWGDLGDDDKQANEEALQSDERPLTSPRCHQVLDPGF
jgi:hypothetical protein